MSGRSVSGVSFSMTAEGIIREEGLGVLRGEGKGNWGCLGEKLELNLAGKQKDEGEGGWKGDVREDEAERVAVKGI